MAKLIAGIPWWLTTIVLLAGCVMLVYANRRAKPGLRTIGLVVVSLAALLVATHFLVDTDAEKCERRTRQMVDAVDKKDWNRLQTLLDGDTTASFGNKTDLAALGHLSGIHLGPEDIAKYGKETDKEVNLKAASIFSLRTEQTPGLITVVFTAYTEQDDKVTGGRPFPSDWEFDYNQSGDRWDLKQIKLLSLGNESTQ